MNESLRHGLNIPFLVEAAGLSHWSVDAPSLALQWSIPSSWQWGGGGVPKCRSLDDFLEVVEPADRYVVQTAINDALGDASFWSFQCRVREGASSVRWLEIKGHTLRDGETVLALHGVAVDISEQKRLAAVSTGQQHALEMAVQAHPLQAILDRLTRSLEEQAGNRLWASIMLVDEERGLLGFGSRGSLPPTFSQAIDGLEIAPTGASCGAAAHFGRPVIAEHIASDAHWVRYQAVAAAHGIAASWSVPIRSVTGEILGTLACYSPEPRRPDAFECNVLDLLVNTASLVLERERERAYHHSLKQDLHASEELFRSLVHATSSVVWTADQNLEIETPQPSWGAFTGQTFEQMKGFGWADAVHPEDIAAAMHIGQVMRRSLKPAHTEYRLKRADGAYRHMSGYAVPILAADGTVRYWAGSYTDVTERKEAESRLNQLANHDPLTGLPNRSYLDRHLQELFNFTPEDACVAIMLIDLDDFKQVNDSLGHGAGDSMLCEVAQRITAVLPAGDLVARLGGDEFVIVAHVRDCNAALELAAGLIACIETPLVVGSNTFHSGASIGVSLFPEQGHTAADLMLSADIAMYHAKKAGGSRAQLFNPQMREQARSRIALSAALRTAVECEELHVVYQPRLCLHDMRMVGVEALVRWNRPESGPVSPLDFIPIAEQIGLIDTLGQWVLETALRDISQLNAKQGSALAISVNMSPVQLRTSALIERTQSALVRSGFPATSLEFEVTEGALIDDTEASRQVMEGLKALGVRLAVDDFGTGYAGLSYLRRFPIDVVKLDRSFVTGIAGDVDRYLFTRAIVDMARSLKLHVVAEGVEDADTLELLREVGCDEAQGYLFARPLSLDELAQFARRGPGLP